MKKQLSVALFFFTLVSFAAPSAPSKGRQSAAPSQPPPSEKQNSRPADQQNEAAKSGKGAAPQNAATKDKDEVVRISVTLVQVDAVVTDGKGGYVTDLKPEDFEISEDGKRQHITNFSYVSAQPPAAGCNSANRPSRASTSCRSSSPTGWRKRNTTRRRSGLILRSPNEVRELRRKWS